MSRALLVGVVLAVVALLGASGYRASYDCIGTHCGMVFVPTEGAPR